MFYSHPILSVIVSPKSRVTTDHAWSSSASVYASAEISCVQPTSHISFGICFKLGKWLAMPEIWPPYSFGSPGVKIILWGVKNIKHFDYCLVRAIGHSFFLIYCIPDAKRGYYGFIIVRALVRRDFLLATYSPHFFPDFFHIWQVA